MMATFQITGPDGRKYRVTGETPAGAMAALKKAMGADAGLNVSVDPATNQPPGVPAFVPPGVEGYDPQTGEVTPEFGKTRSAAYGAADTTTFGFGDEMASYLGSAISGKPREQVLAEMRGLQDQAQKQNPKSYLAGQIAGGVAQGVASAPASLSARAAGMALLPRVAAGMGDGAVMGALYGAGSGTDAESRAWEAGKGGAFGLAAGAAFPLISTGAGKVYEAARNALSAGPVAHRAGTTPEALRVLGGVLDADGSLGPSGQANMARAGQEAMLVDAGPTARRALDTAIQRSGPGAVVARDAVQGRVARDSGALTQALDDALGKPQGITATRDAIREGSAAGRGSAYREAYKQAIDYADPRGRAIEGMVKSRVPQSAINHANALMRADGHQSQQILARVADDGTVAFERLPDVRQLDYITRALNDLADAGEGAGALGGQTSLGRAYQNLSREIRDNLRDLVPEYGKALETAADPIRRSKAVELGGKLLSPSMTRDEAFRFVAGMTKAERQALAQGVRSRIDDAMANVTRTVQDGDVPAREAIKALKDLSSRANQQKLSLAIGSDQSKKLFKEIDRITASFELRAAVADNSATYARQAMERRVGDFAAPDTMLRTAKRGEPLQATKRAIQSLTGETAAAVKGREDALYGELARLLTMQGGPGQNVYNAIGNLGRTDQATQLMMDRISRGLSGPHLSYPSAMLATDRIGQ